MYRDCGNVQARESLQHMRVDSPTVHIPINIVLPSVIFCELNKNGDRNAVVNTLLVWTAHDGAHGINQPMSGFANAVPA